MLEQGIERLEAALDALQPEPVGHHVVEQAEDDAAVSHPPVTGVAFVRRELGPAHVAIEPEPEPEPEPAMAAAPGQKAGIMGAVKGAFSRSGKGHVHDFVEAPGGIGIARSICRECGYVSISSAD